MIEQHCRSKHNPPDSYGDCVRAAVASILELTIDQVPHFFEDGCDGDTGHNRLVEWANSCGWHPFYLYIDASAPLEDVLKTMEMTNPNVYYLLWGHSMVAPHVVVACNNKIVHDPTWYGSGIVRAAGELWGVTVFIPRVLCSK